MDAIEAIYRRESPFILATLIRLLGSFELAEDAVQAAFLAAAQQWKTSGIPANPRSWLISTGRFKTIDLLRRNKRFKEIAPELTRTLDEPMEQAETEAMPDDMLRLIFTCCHPALPADAQSALCLREICGLSTEAIAAAFLSKPATIAQRIVRAKSRIRDERIAYTVPEGEELLGRLDHVARVIYLMFSEGYAASSGDELIRTDLCVEAIRLGRLLYGHLPHPDIAGLLGLMLLQTSRLAARIDASGAAIPLDEQDTGLWDTRSVVEGADFVAVALRAPPYSPYTLQAAIAAIHAQRLNSGATDWIGIVRWYDLLRIADPGSIVELNRIIAIGMRDGAAIGLRELDARDWSALPPAYRYLTLTRADFLRRLGRTQEAHAGYRTALESSPSDAESKFITRRLRQMDVIQ